MNATSNPEPAGDKGIEPSRRSPVSEFRRSFLITAVPIVALSLISLAGKLLIGAYYVWFLAATVDGAAIPAAAGFAIARHFQVAAGIIAGVALGIVALGLSCFANLSWGRF